jgi:hypothetical protein
MWTNILYSTYSSMFENCLRSKIIYIFNISLMYGYNFKGGKCKNCTYRSFVCLSEWSDILGLCENESNS